MLKKFFAVLAIGLAAALILCWIYLPSITRYRELKSEEDRLSQKIRDIDAQIKVLADERHLLQNDLEYLEKVIREELGFVKPGEIVYELVANKNLSDTAPVSPEVSVTPGKTSTSIAKASEREKATMSPASLAASLANTAPKSSKKKTSLTLRTT